MQRGRCPRGSRKQSVGRHSRRCLPLQATRCVPYTLGTKLSWGHDQAVGLCGRVGAMPCHNCCSGGLNELHSRHLPSSAPSAQPHHCAAIGLHPGHESGGSSEEWLPVEGPRSTAAAAGGHSMRCCAGLGWLMLSPPLPWSSCFAG